MSYLINILEGKINLKIKLKFSEDVSFSVPYNYAGAVFLQFVFLFVLLLALYTVYYSLTFVCENSDEVCINYCNLYEYQVLQ